MSFSSYLDAIKETAVQLETVINHAQRLNLIDVDRVAVVAAGSEAVALATLINKNPNLLRAAVLKEAPLSVAALVNMKPFMVERLASRQLAQILDPTAHLPLNGTSTNILVLETNPSSISAESAITYVSSLHQNSNNTGLALLDVPLTGRPHMRNLLKSPLTKPFLLRTLCPNWLINQTCV